MTFSEEKKEREETERGRGRVQVGVRWTTYNKLLRMSRDFKYGSKNLSLSHTHTLNTFFFDRISDLAVGVSVNSHHRAKNSTFRKEVGRGQAAP